jgi:hypothetical protein
MKSIVDELENTKQQAVELSKKESAAAAERRVHIHQVGRRRRRLVSFLPVSRALGDGIWGI